MLLLCFKYRIQSTENCRACPMSSFGLDEMPTRDFFIGRYVHQWHTIVANLRPTGRVIGCFNFGPSFYSRSANTVLADGSSIIAPEYRGRGLGRILTGVWAWGLWVSKYKGMQVEWSMDNVASGRLSMRGTVLNGVLPRAVFYRDVGWVDCCLAYQATEMLDRNGMMQALQSTGIDPTKGKL